MSASRPTVATQKPATVTDVERDQLVAAHVDLARKIAFQVYRGIDCAVELDELVAIAFEGLVQAAARFRTGRGAAFRSFARYRIRGAIYDELRRSGIPRRAYRALALRNLAAPPTVRRRHDAADADAAPDWGGVPPAPRPTVEETAMRREVAGILAETIERLPADEKSIIRAHYYAGASLKEAGSARGLSRSWASRLHARGLAELRLRLSALAPELTD